MTYQQVHEILNDLGRVHEEAAACCTAVDDASDERLRLLAGLFHDGESRLAMRLKQAQEGAQPYSLDQIEHEILRKLEEPRIHFAIVCASHSCPRLWNRAYTAADPGNFRHEPAQRVFHLSSILSWFADDFGRDQATRLRTIAAYLPTREAYQASRRRDRFRRRRVPKSPYPPGCIGGTERSRTGRVPRATSWLVAAVLTAVSLFNEPDPASAQPTARESGPLAGSVVAEWQQAGALFGWITIDPQSDWQFHREKQLRILTLGRMVDAGLNELATLDHLHTLHIISTSVTNEGRKALPRLKALRTLTIWSSGGGVSDAGLNELGKMTQLQSLSLRHTTLKYEHLQVLGRLKQLETLDLFWTDAVIGELQEALPAATIIASRPPL